MREFIQEKAVTLSREYKNLVLEFATGVGKTRALLKCIEKSLSPKKWLILVPEISLIENFKKDAIKHGYQDLLEEKIENIICYASLKNYSGSSLNLGLDECHHVSELKGELIDTIKSDQRIALSATIPFEIKERLNSMAKWHYYKITTKEAIDMGIIPRPKIYIHQIVLDDKVKKHKVKYGKSTISKTSRGYLDYLNTSISYWIRKQDEGNKYATNKILTFSMLRKRYLASQKDAKAIEILKNLQYKRTITFCGSVEQANKLGGKEAVHSRNSKTKNESLILDFNEERSSRLFACSMLKEGQNLTNIEAGVIVQLAGNDKENVQAIGRLLRSENPELHIIIVKNSKDEDYLRNFLEIVEGKEIIYL